MKLTGNDLIQIGYTEGKALGIALTLLDQQLANESIENQLSQLATVLKQPVTFITDGVLGPLAQELLKPADNTISLKEETHPYSIYGAEAIEAGALKQM